MFKLKNRYCFFVKGGGGTLALKNFFNKTWVALIYQQLCDSAQIVPSSNHLDGNHHHHNDRLPLFTPRLVRHRSSVFHQMVNEVYLRPKQMLPPNQYDVDDAIDHIGMGQVQWFLFAILSPFLPFIHSITTICDSLALPCPTANNAVAPIFFNSFSPYTVTFKPSFSKSLTLSAYDFGYITFDGSEIKSLVLISTISLFLQFFYLT